MIYPRGYQNGVERLFSLNYQCFQRLPFQGVPGVFQGGWNGLSLSLL